MIHSIYYRKLFIEWDICFTSIYTQTIQVSLWYMTFMAFHLVVHYVIQKFILVHKKCLIHGVSHKTASHAHILPCWKQAFPRVNNYIVRSYRDVTVVTNIVTRRTNKANRVVITKIKKTLRNNIHKIKQGNNGSIY